MKQPRLVVIGNGMAGIRTVEELLKLMPGMYHITVFGAEPHPNYNRILLSPVLAGEQEFDDIVLNPLQWYRDNGIHLHLNKEVVRIDRVRRRVIAADGTEAEYDRLLIATGSVPFVLPIPGNDLKGVIGYRDIQDTRTMIDTARSKQHAVVIGGGLLGLEAANGLKVRGMEVTVVHLAGWLLERQLDPVAGNLLQQALRARGLEFRLNTATSALLGNAQGEVIGVRFADGSEIPADLVVMAAGIRPNTRLAEEAGIHCSRGIVVNDSLQSFDPRVYAVGECANHRGIAYGLVAPLFEQAKVCANHLAQFGIGIYRGSVASTKLKVTGIDLFSAGDFMGGDGCEEIVLSDPAGGVYKKLVIRDDVLVGMPVWRHQRWWLVFQAAQGRHADPGAARSIDLRRKRVGRFRHRWPGSRQRDVRQRRSLRLQWRVQGHHRQGDQRAGPVHRGRGEEAHQGGQFVWLVHRAGGADPDELPGLQLPGNP